MAADSTDSTTPRPKWAAKWLEVMRSTGNVRLACQAVNINRDTPHKLRDRDPSFAADWDEAYEDSLDLLVAESRRRALKGSDRLMELELKSRLPKIYRDKSRIDLNVNDIRNLTDEQLDALEERIAAREAATRLAAEGEEGLAE